MQLCTIEEEYRIQNGLNAPLPLTEFSNLDALYETLKANAERRELAYGRGFRPAIKFLHHQIVDLVVQKRRLFIRQSYKIPN
ncbi:MAG: hypothetical protein RMY29_027900 [Nostoc sp. CreGUA01]|nr:hypothetical protein [Nostoc sp. CreGUA01]